MGVVWVRFNARGPTWSKINFWLKSLFGSLQKTHPTTHRQPSLNKSIKRFLLSPHVFRGRPQTCILVSREIGQWLEASLARALWIQVGNNSNQFVETKDQTKLIITGSLRTLDQVYFAPPSEWSVNSSSIKSSPTNPTSSDRSNDSHDFHCKIE